MIWPRKRLEWRKFQGAPPDEGRRAPGARELLKRQKGAGCRLRGVVQSESNGTTPCSKNRTVPAFLYSLLHLQEMQSSRQPHWNGETERRVRVWQCQLCLRADQAGHFWHDQSVSSAVIVWRVVGHHLFLKHNPQQFHFMARTIRKHLCDRGHERDKVPIVPMNRLVRQWEHIYIVVRCLSMCPKFAIWVIPQNKRVTTQVFCPSIVSHVWSVLISCPIKAKLWLILLVTPLHHSHLPLDSTWRASY